MNSFLGPVALLKMRIKSFRGLFLQNTLPIFVVIVNRFCAVFLKIIQNYVNNKINN